MAYGKTISKKNGYELVAIVNDVDPDEVLAFAIRDLTGREIDRYYKLVTASYAFDSLARGRPKLPAPNSNDPSCEP